MLASTQPSSLIPVNNSVSVWPQEHIWEQWVIERPRQDHIPASLSIEASCCANSFDKYDSVLIKRVCRLLAFFACRPSRKEDNTFCLGLLQKKMDPEKESQACLNGKGKRTSCQSSNLDNQIFFKNTQERPLRQSPKRAPYMVLQRSYKHNTNSSK